MADTLSPGQIRGARGMLDWSMLDLARAAGLSVSTVKRLEMKTSQPVSGKAYAAVREAFETFGVRFLSDGDRGTGMMMDARNEETSPSTMANVAFPT
ncbi:helix-turn-helix transcriptional regulator [Lichenibacterium ramalinae]|uniref:helix-turn-helix transcriptional regulator n=1 Tax=Lichenibacterium ramalinae TaxID=2316527 RepID=UPI00100FDF62|nr:helix-turn-helix transcriptional regulator [Lichenibacterium ramalinae]